MITRCAVRAIRAVRIVPEVGGTVSWLTPRTCITMRDYLLHCAGLHIWYARGHSAHKNGGGGGGGGGRVCNCTSWLWLGGMVGLCLNILFIV